MPEPTPESEKSLQPIERQLRRGNINFDFLNPVELPRTEAYTGRERRAQPRTGKRGLFNRGRKVRVLSGWYALPALVVFALCVYGLIFVWESRHYLVLFAIPILLSTALAALILFGLLLARPR
ncbi:MAG: hypothetical protein N2Z22_01795 [Turneriella sp.]|nr:hypothetical protein [Turneriella sp.]